MAKRRPRKAKLATVAKLVILAAILAFIIFCIGARIGADAAIQNFPHCSTVQVFPAEPVPPQAELDPYNTSFVCDAFADLLTLCQKTA